MAFAAATHVCLCGRYTLLGKLGAGGHGEVWRTRDHERGIEIALKILSPELARAAGAWEALQREYDIASRLDHPLILKIYQPEREEGAVFLPMELAPGGDLRRLRSVSYLEIGPVLLEVAQALEHTHERGIVHRDLKPGNVLFDSRGHVRLADFGVAGTVLGSAATAATSTRAGLSPFTASPEQLRGEPPAVADDIYGLGALAYELLSGYPPYYPRFELRRAIEEPVPQLKAAHQAPDRLIGLVMAMLSKRAERRPRSMREIIDSIDSMLNDTLEFDTAAEPSLAVPDAPGPNVHELNAPVLNASEPDAHELNAPAINAPVLNAPEPVRAQTMARETRPASRVSEVVRPRRPPKPGETVGPRRSAAVATVSADGSAAASTGGSAAASAGTSAVASTPPTGLPPETSHASVPLIDSFAPMRASRAEPAQDPDLRALWGDMKMERVPGTDPRAPEHRVRWSWVLIVGLATVAVASFFGLPHWTAERSWAPSSLAFLQRLDPQAVANAVKRTVTAPLHALQPASGQATHHLATGQAVNHAATPADALPAPAAVTEDDVRAARTHLEARLASLDARGAGIWGGQSYADAKAREAEASGADEAGNLSVAAQKLAEAERLLSEVEQSAPSALAAQLASGERALKAGNGAAARQAFDLARLIDPGNSQAADGLQRAQALDHALPLLADGMNAEASHNYSRAVRDYRQMLSRDPRNAEAQAGLKRASAALGAAQYARAVGIGLDALGDGRLQAARQAFELAHRINRGGREAEQGLERVSSELQARELTQLESRGAALEAQQRWSAALLVYDRALSIDPSLSFAQQGKARVAARARLEGVRLASPAAAGADLAGASRAPADLTSRLQALVDDPQQLDSQAVRAEAAALLREASATQPAGALLRQYTVRLSALLQDYDKTVHLALTSDNLTEVEISQIGSFGTFSRREIDLKPGRYTVIGTRAGYRDVRRDVTIEPGEETQTISVRCEEPI